MKLLIKVFGLIFITTMLFGGTKRYLDAHRSAVEAKNRAEALTIINDSIQARVALLKRERDLFESLYEAERVLNGKLIAAIDLHVPPETVYVSIKAVDTLIEDSTRLAILTDTTESGIEVEVSALAPPFPSPLQIGYKIVTPPFDPQIGFIEDGAYYHAVLTWRGNKAEIRNAFFLPPSTSSTLSLRSGARMRQGTKVEPVDVYGALHYSLSPRWELQAVGGWSGQSY